MIDRRTTEKGTGTEFVAERRAVTAENVAASEHLVAGKSISILVVDDIEDNAEMLSELLEERGYRVLTASSGAIALELLDQSLPDLVLLDIGLPGMDGYEVATTIRTRFGDKVCLIALTGLSGAAACDKARRSGFDAFLVKPFRVEDVEAALIRMAQ